MYKKVAGAVFTLSTLLAGSSTTLADSYAGGSIASAKYSETGVDSDATLNTLYGRLGTHFNHIFSGEIRLGAGIGDDSVTYMDVPVDVSLENMYGAYLRGGIPVSDVVFPYAALGYTRAKIEASTAYGNASESESDVSFGLGVDFNMNNGLVLNIEYMSYFDKDEAEIDAFSIGLAKTF